MARRRIILMQPDWFAQILIDGGPAFRSGPTLVESVTSDCPADLRIVGCGWDEARNLVRVAVESETFDEVPDGYFAPEWTPTYTSHVMTRFEAALEVLKG